MQQADAEVLMAVVALAVVVVEVEVVEGHLQQVKLCSLEEEEDQYYEVGAQEDIGEFP